MSLALIGFYVSAETHKAKQAQNNQQPSTPVADAPIQQDSSPSIQPKPDQHIKADVRVIETPAKDGYDKAAFWISVALAVIGIAGVGIGICTLLLLRRQTTEIKRQADQMEAQLEEMQKVSEIENKTLILQYRPKIIVRFASASEFNLADLGKPATAKVQLTIANTGGSPAHISVGQVALWWTEVSSSHSNRVVIHEGTGSPIGESTLQPGEQYRWAATLNMDAINDLQWVNYHEGLTTEDYRTLRLVGALYYTDGLNIPRSTGIHRNYDPKMKNFKPSDAEGEYSD